MTPSQVYLKDFSKILIGNKIDSVSLSKLVQSGNLKIPRTTAIFNMSSAHNCPSYRLGLCKVFNKKGKHVCYALRAENSMRKHVYPFRERQKEYWLSCLAEQFVSEFLIINSLKMKPWDSLRFNEAGDFHTQDCVTKAELIASLLSKFGIKVYCYTSRSDLDFSNLKNLIVYGSGFTKNGISGEFLMVHDLNDRPKGYGICPKNCRICSRCKVKGLKTVVKMH